MRTNCFFSEAWPQTHSEHVFFQQLLLHLAPLPNAFLCEDFFVRIFFLTDSSTTPAVNGGGGMGIDGLVSPTASARGRRSTSMAIRPRRAPTRSRGRSCVQSGQPGAHPWPDPLRKKQTQNHSCESSDTTAALATVVAAISSPTPKTTRNSPQIGNFRQFSANLVNKF